MLLAEVYVVGLRSVVECLVQAPTVVLAVAVLEKTKSCCFFRLLLHISLHDMWWLGVVAMEFDEVYFPSFYSHGFSFFGACLARKLCRLRRRMLTAVGLRSICIGLGGCFLGGRLLWRRRQASL